MHPDALPATPDKDRVVAEAVEAAAEVVAGPVQGVAVVVAELPESPLA